MRCFNCGAELTINPFCTNCGADIREYRRIIWTSNQYYNDGLTKAKVRDLSGAVLSLRACLKLNRTNIEARNLLGLVYFEMGEAVAAFAEWVVSKSLKPDKNIADDFMDTIQSNPGRLDTINHSIKKYNQALAYARQGSLDLSVIQLKKVLQMNPNLVVAYELLGLLYLQGEEFNRARRILNQALRIDRNNTRVLYYLKEAEEGIASRYSGDSSSRRRRQGGGRTSADAITYTSGNETIIQPVNSGDRGGSSALLNIIIGAVIGCLLMLFLVLPARIRSANNKMNDQLKEVSDELTVKDADIEEQKKEIQALQSENDELKGSLGDLSGESGMGERYDYLAQAALNYIKDPNDVTGTESMLALIPVGSVSANALNLEIETVGDLDPTIYSQSFRDLYNYLNNDVASRAARTYIDRGRQEFEDGQYQSAIEDLTKATEIAPLNDEAWYYLAESYKQSGDSIHATQAYSRIVNEMADSDYADRARTNLSNGAAADETTDTQDDNNTADQDTAETVEETAADPNADLIAQALAMQALQAGAGADDADAGAE